MPATPKSGWVSLKDFTVAPYNGRQLVYATIHGNGTSWGYGLLPYRPGPLTHQR
ncbi:non-reducing end alpha-L-arabinofuranosidase family hydrolase [Streptosporangium subroseum]|nr:non-reducing end alpha-L-arabinofuranosidase family hydrolase [Streptosporangium subroseum]